MYKILFITNTATTEIYTLSLHDALPISEEVVNAIGGLVKAIFLQRRSHILRHPIEPGQNPTVLESLSLKPTNAFSGDRKSTRLNSSHSSISYAVFCLKKKNIILSNIIQL